MRVMKAKILMVDESSDVTAVSFFMVLLVPLSMSFCICVESQDQLEP